MARKSTLQEQDRSTAKQATKNFLEVKQENQVLKGLYRDLIEQRMGLEQTFLRLQAAFFALAAAHADNPAGTTTIDKTYFETPVLNVSFTLDEETGLVTFVVVVAEPEPEEEQDLALDDAPDE